jgi:hypothetical protein
MVAPLGIIGALVLTEELLDCAVTDTTGLVTIVRETMLEYASTPKFVTLRR